MAKSNIQGVYKWILHCTVDKDCRVSLWDSKETALAGKDKWEVYIPLELTSEQYQMFFDTAIKIEQRS